MRIFHCTNAQYWESFLQDQSWSPFLQSWTMGEVYREIGQEPIRLVVESDGDIVGVCEAVVVPARRGRHLMVQYGPVIRDGVEKCHVVAAFTAELKRIGTSKDCVCIRMSPYVTEDDIDVSCWKKNGYQPSPLHLLAEHIWYLELRNKTEEDVLMGMRKTTRNLIRRAEREGVVVTASENPLQDLELFFSLYEETRKRHSFVPYSNAFIRAQVEQFVPHDQCRVYVARYNDEPVAASVHMVYGGETSYHHGASTTKYPKIPASYLLQWTAIKEAIARGDRVYNFWGIAPVQFIDGKWRVLSAKKKHPFLGVTTFKTGFGGSLLNLHHCIDLPLSIGYWKMWLIEMIRKWKRGF